MKSYFLLSITINRKELEALGLWLRGRLHYAIKLLKTSVLFTATGSNTGGTCFDNLQSADFSPINLRDIYKQT